MYRLYLRQKIEAGIEDADEGSFIPHEEVFKYDTQPCSAINRTIVWLVGFLFFWYGGAALAQDQDRLHVGLQPDGRIVVPTNQILSPAGKQITFPGRPVDLALAEDGQVLVAKNLHDLMIIDVASGAVKQRLPMPLPLRGEKELGFSVVGLLSQGERIYVTDTHNHLRVAQRKPDGVYRWASKVQVEAPKVGSIAHPAGIDTPAPGEVWITSTRGNNVQRINLSTGKVEQVIPVGVAPYTLCFAGPDRCYVSNWGGDPPRGSHVQALSSDTPIRIDSRTGVANHGSLSVLGRVDGQWKQLKTIEVGLHPCGLVFNSRANLLFVANANSDTVCVIDTKADLVLEAIGCRPEARLPFGSGSNALALNPDGGTLYVANGTNNCIVVVHLSDRASGHNSGRVNSTIAGLIPTGWYPGAIKVSQDGKKLFVANIKGHGALDQPRPVTQGRKTKDHLGTISVIDFPDDAAQLAKYTAEVNRNNRLAYSLAGLEKPRANARPIAVPQRHGEPSLFKHVFYIIKENRTYDQVFGDMKEGNGDSNLTIFGEDVTPNQHALAREFTLFDNFYCSGVLSADGHSWCNEAYVTDYLERAFGGWVRSYPPDQDDPLAYPSTGFLWNNALAHGKTIRNYGEYVNDDYAPKGTSWTDGYNDYKNGTHKVPIRIHATLKALEPFTHKGFPWFPLLFPDVYRAKLFIEDLRKYEQKGDLPNLIYLTLPCNHTEGTTPGFPTPRAMAADNDVALGQVVEAITTSKFWKDSCILVVEDDPQNGFDHVDAHRTVALAISPYTKRHYVDHTNYNQTGMVKTIELMLGLPPMNQLDLSATPMRYCFQEEPDLKPYKALPNRIDLTEMNPPVEKLHGKAKFWAEKSMALNFEKGDEADEDTLNRILWHSARGYDTPYPAIEEGDD
jgi:DNA-binding beta-propeller fold protein YncE